MDFITRIGPSDPLLKRSEAEGYQPVSRIGEIVTNAFVDPTDFVMIDKESETDENKPYFHEWASVLPGMILVARKDRTCACPPHPTPIHPRNSSHRTPHPACDRFAARYRHNTSAETASAVISSAYGLTWGQDEKKWFFAGIARSKSVRVIDDGHGPVTDDFFTSSIGGMATILNNGRDPIHPGDALKWSFDVPPTRPNNNSNAPRRIMVTKLTDKESPWSTATHFGRALSFAKAGEPVDVLIKQ